MNKRGNREALLLTIAFILFLAAFIIAFSAIEKKIEPLPTNTTNHTNNNQTISGLDSNLCADGIDNDGDGFTDYPADASCATREDNDELNPRTSCQDGLDNDNDGWIDITDPGCVNSQDMDEHLIGITQCSDEMDNDLDGRIDGRDPECEDTLDNNETANLNQTTLVLRLPEEQMVHLSFDQSSWDSLTNSLSDLSGNNNTASILGTYEMRPGIVSQAAFFNGTYPLITLPNPDQFQFKTQDFAIGMWFNAETTVGKRTLIAKHFAQIIDNPYGGFRISIEDGLLRLRVGDGKTLAEGGKNYVITKENIDEHSWYHLIMVRQGQVLHLYLNGEETAHIVLPTNFEVKNPPSWMAPVAIGSLRHWITMDGFKGSIDDLIIYNRSLSTDEIRQWYTFYARPSPHGPACHSFDFIFDIGGWPINETWLNQYADPYPLVTRKIISVGYGSYNHHPYIHPTTGVAYNGGVPQKANLTEFKESMQAEILNWKNFTQWNFNNGYGQLDYEEWFPQWDFMNNTIYQTRSIEIVQQANPSWTPQAIQAEAKRQYEAGAKTFMLAAIQYAKEVAPEVKWCFYRYPYNRYGEGYSTERGDIDRALNNEIDWLWQAQDTICPETYTITNTQYYDPSNSYMASFTPEVWRQQAAAIQAQYWRNAVKEGLRVSHRVNDKPVIPFTMYRYWEVTGEPYIVQLMDPFDLAMAYRIPYEEGADGALIFGFESYPWDLVQLGFNPVHNYSEVGPYMHSTLGPAVEEIKSQAC